jgi:predicted GH43/DUF377 family glycosyl hydrolase
MIIELFEGNPILEPIGKQQLGIAASFNAAAILLNKQVHLLYRAMAMTTYHV